MNVSPVQKTLVVISKKHVCENGGLMTTCVPYKCHQTNYHLN
jgi:hypothetical protein